MQKIFWVLIWAKGAKIGPETRFFAIFSSLLHQFSLKLHTMIACNHVQHLVEVKFMKKNLGANLVQGGQNRSQNQVFCYFLKFALLVFLEIAYSDRLQQCVTCSRNKIFEKKIWGPNLVQSGQNRASNQFFCYFFKLGLLVFLKIAYNDSLQQYVTCSRGKISEKHVWALIWSKGVKVGPNTRFFSIF